MGAVGAPPANRSQAPGGAWTQAKPGAMKRPAVADFLGVRGAGSDAVCPFLWARDPWSRSWAAVNSGRIR